jgi:hypothetical protein
MGLESIPLVSITRTRTIRKAPYENLR